MTCRIERFVTEESQVVLRICGRITEQDVETLRASLEQERGMVAAIDLKDVLILNRETIRLLAIRESAGVELRNCPAYIREWVTKETNYRDAGEKRTKRKEGAEDA